MFFKFLKSNSSFVLVFVAIVGIAMATNNFLYMAKADAGSYQGTTKEVILYHKLLHTFNTKEALNILAASFLLFTSFFLIRFNNNHRLIETQTYMFSLFFLLISNGFLAHNTIHPIIFAQLFVVLAINQLFACFKQETAVAHIFEASFLLSVSSLFYFNTIYYFILLFIAIGILRSFFWREWLMPFIGLSLPYILILSYSYLFENDSKNIYHSVLDNYKILFTNSFPGFFLPLASIMILILLISGNYIFRKKAMKISTRKYYLILIWYTVITLLIATLTDGSSPEYFVLLAFPTSYFISTYLMEIRYNWLRTSILWLFMGIFIFYEILKLLAN